MEVVIDITEQDYQLACKYPNALISIYAQAIKNGTPLPKGHGRLGDLNLAYEAIEAFQDSIRSVGEFDAEKASALTLLGRCKELISEVDTIIEADTGE